MVSLQPSCDKAGTVQVATIQDPPHPTWQAVLHRTGRPSVPEIRKLGLVVAICVRRLRTLSSAAPTSANGSALWCCRTAPFLGSAAAMASPAWIVVAVALRDRPLHHRSDIRWRTRRAWFHASPARCGIKTAITSAVDDLVNPSSAKPGHGVVTKATRATDFRISRHPSNPRGEYRSQMSTASAKFGTSARLAASGSPPVRATFRFTWATVRASVSVVHRVEPSPISCRLPLMVRRCT